MNELMAYKVRMPFRSRITWRRWFPVWVGFTRATYRGQVNGAYVRLGAIGYFVHSKPRSR
jgi:hypothetical protein